jgi:hypothetical protein
VTSMQPFVRAEIGLNDVLCQQLLDLRTSVMRPWLR